VEILCNIPSPGEPDRRNVQTGLLIGLCKHAIWAESFYYLYVLLLPISKILASSQPTIRPSS
jgi:hypothetical protein